MLDLNALFDSDMLGDDLEAWLAESALMKRTFRNCAIISGLIARRYTGEEKSRRQVLFSTDLIYDVLRKHQADHVLAARRARRCRDRAARSARDWVICLRASMGEITHRELDHVSPLAVPVMLEIGRESVYGEASDELLAEAADELVKEATGTGIERDDSAQSSADDRECAHFDGLDCRRHHAIADLTGALFWEEQRAARRLRSASGKGSSFATRGVLLPPYDTAATLSRLAAVIARHNPRMVIALGDSFHDRTRPCAPRRRRIATPSRALQARPRLDLDIGQSRSGIAVGSRRHGRDRSRDRPHRVPPLSRHRRRSARSPATCIPRPRVPTRGRTMERRCFACDGERAVMPAFGAYAGGLSIRDAALRKICSARQPSWPTCSGDSRVHAIAASRCH